MRYGLIGLNGDPCRSPRNTIVVNPVRPGREQRQRQSGVQGCGWQGLLPLPMRNL